MEDEEMEFLDGSWKKEVSSWDALMGEELLNHWYFSLKSGSSSGRSRSQHP